MHTAPFHPSFGSLGDELVHQRLSFPVM